MSEWNVTATTQGITLLATTAAAKSTYAIRLYYNGGVRGDNPAAN